MTVPLISHPCIPLVRTSCPMIHRICSIQTTRHIDMQGVVDVAIYGRIATLELFRPTVSRPLSRAGSSLNENVLTVDWHEQDFPRPIMKAAMTLCATAGRI